MKNVFVVAMFAFFLFGCTSAEIGKFSALGGSQHVVLMDCAGHAIQEWDTNGTVHNEENSDGLYFEDYKTHKLVRIAGTFVVTQN